MFEKCSIDVLNWFDKDPTNDTENIQRCVTNNFNKKEDFLQSFNKKIVQQEMKNKISMKGGSNNGSGKKRKRWITLSIMSVTLLISIASAVVGYKYVMKTLNDNKLREALEGKDLLNFQKY